MASSRLGSQNDIHSGGIDLAFPHHDNELAQSEAYWSEKKQQWVNYFLHMGHLSIQGPKMSKSLKNFTTVRSALDKGDWNPRSLRIVFLLGGWRDGVEITPELIQTASAYQGVATDGSSDPIISLAQALATAKEKVHEYFCDSLDTPKVMGVISELITTFNNVDQNANPNEVQELAQWVTRIVTILGLNGKVSPESCGIGWEGTDIPEPAKQFLYPLSAMRDALREATKSQGEVTHQQLKAITAETIVDERLVSQASRPYFQVFRDFHARISPSNSEDTPTSSKELLSLCDRLRDVELFDLGIYLEDRENKPALVRPVTRDLLQSREEHARKMLLKQQEKEKQEKLAKERLEKGRLSHLDMFRTSEFSAWDEDGMPTKDASSLAPNIWLVVYTTTVVDLVHYSQELPTTFAFLISRLIIVRMRTRWIFTVALLVAPLALGSIPATKLIIDTDLFSDVDDAAALLVACDHPMATPIGVMINYPSSYSALAASSILGYYGYSDVPVALKQPFSNDTFLDTWSYQLGEYASKVAYNWRHTASMPWGDVSSAWDPVELYRKLLSEAGDHSVTIASIGFLDNLSELLSSPGDTYSSLSGHGLVKAKVKELVIMGGAYPCGYEYNFYGSNASATAHVVNTWPGPMTFSGGELGATVYSGARLTVEGPISDPVNAAYRWYTGYNISRSSWDPLTVLYAIDGLSNMFVYANKGGHNYIYPDGRNEWLPDSPLYPQKYLKLRMSEEEAGELLDNIYLDTATRAAR
ncbi:inosine/uridine-preferring nucleoside hydrolase [Aspergillus flavus]|nr:inosine/uridine-preferring nucleoside hydrolase [Aspergillus flavus]